MKKILIVFGTRPEAIKMAPVIHELKKYKNDFELKICVTGQHRKMLDQFLTIFNIQPDFDLDIMKIDQDLFDITSNILISIKAVLEYFKPDIVLAQGDTTTTLSASLAAFYKKIPIGHIEAGLRTNNVYSPWPEEMNRQLTDRISKYLFVPTQISKDNLVKENIDEKSIIITGNTIIDSLYWMIGKIRSDRELQRRLGENLDKQGYKISRNGRRIILVTGHRRENFGEGFLNICHAIKDIAINNSKVDIIYPVHLNPNVRKPVNDILSGIYNIYLIEPLDYETFVYLMNKSYIILTDSGGIQEEAPSLGKPVLVMRNTTERPEAVEAGTVKLVGTNKETIIKETNNLLYNCEIYNNMSKAHNPYGDGLASKRIINYLRENL